MALKKSQKSLKKWTAQKAYENRKKRKATKSGKTRARYSKSVRKKMRGK